MSRRYAVGVLNGNWKNRWRRDIDYWQDQQSRLIEKNKARFANALDELKQADPVGWEAWFDDDNNIPPTIYWSDEILIGTLCQRMREAMESHCQGAFQKIPP
jgi:hypothetical protein